MLKGLLKFSARSLSSNCSWCAGDVLLRLPLNIVITDIGLTSALMIVLRLIAGTMPLALMLSITQMNDLSMFW